MLCVSRRALGVPPARTPAAWNRAAKLKFGRVACSSFSSGVRIARHGPPAASTTSPPAPPASPSRVLSLRLSPLVLGGALGVALSACAFQRQKARAAGQEAALLRERQQALAGLLESERQARLDAEARAQPRAAQPAPGCGDFRVGQRVFLLSALKSSGDGEAFAAGAAGTVAHLDEAANRVWVRFEQRSRRLKVHPKRLAADRSPEPPLELPLHARARLALRRGFRILLVLCGAFLSGWALCIAYSDNAKELVSMGEALRRAVDSAGERCVICLDRAPNRVIVYCGHLLCSDCAEDAGAEYFADRGCPSCRGQVHGLLPFA